MSWSTKEKTFCVEAYFSTYHTRSSKQILEESFGEHGTVQNFNSKGITDTHSGRRVSARTERNINEVRKSVGRSPKKSLRRRSQELGISRESLRRVLKSDLHVYPY